MQNNHLIGLMMNSFFHMGRLQWRCIRKESEWRLWKEKKRVFWRTNICLLPTGKAGKSFIDETSRLLNAFSPLKNIAFKAILEVVKVGHQFLLPVGNTWNSFVKVRRLPGGHTCHIKRATCNILICLRNTVILRKSGVEKVNIFLNK